MLLLSCKGQDQETTETGTEASSSTGEAAASKFASLQSDIGTAISAEQIKSLLNVTEDISSEVQGRGKFTNLRHSWPSDRTEVLNVGAMKIDKKVDNTVVVSPPKLLKTQGDASFKDVFNRRYQGMTAADVARNKQAVREQMAKTQGKDKVDPLNTLSGDGPDLSFTIEDVPNLADGAKWDAKGKSLMVLDKNQVLSISCDVSDDSKKCLAAAIKVAEQILVNLN